MTGKRDHSVEVYRCLLMLGISMLHAISFSKLGYGWLGNMLHPCVNAFVFITGWYGCRFSVMKLLRLYGVAIFCAMVMTSLLILSGHARSEYSVWLHQLFRTIKNYWFLHAYAVLLMVAPVVNSVFEQDYDKQRNRHVIATILPLLLLAFGWSFLSTFRVCEAYLPHPSGLGSYTPLTLVGVYAVGRYCRWSGCIDSFPRRVQACMLFIAIAISGIGLGRYASPVAVVSAVLSFSLIKSFNVPKAVGHVANWLGPSMFSVYLLQVNDFSISMIRKHANAMSPFAYFVFVTLCLFGSGVAIDAVRRVVVVGLKLLAAGSKSFALPQGPLLRK